MQNYNMSEMKKFMKSLGIPKRKREICVAGIEMFLLNKDDILYIAKESTTESAASNFLHKKVMTM